ncbi:TetR/AcrR family transcriptional regulator [Litorilituus lipolyticus]|uniref:TetR family transcriptional regulator n=1 Tax=Litorilituus lipolyticus TaxID=2491017 RepID=A0A502KMK2_9GAMM|nr:TetR family transcriptional regulator [Litorilituus lipolyticus]TPH12930.1 TetR family transcriptional regulator [Litorilituus lipolyticus]
MTLLETENIIPSSLKSPIRRRTKGEKTKEKILDATIEVLAQKGIKGTTHRAIAVQADLQLSLTTYYFKDIQELIQQAFKHNSEQILSRSDSVLEQAFILLNSTDKTSLRKSSVKADLCEQLTDMTTVYLLDHIEKQAKSLAVEQLLFTEIQVSPVLRELARLHEQAQLLPFEHICGFFNKTDPELDAKLMRTIFTQLKYSLLAKQQSHEKNVEEVRKTANKIISWVIGIK